MYIISTTPNGSGGYSALQSWTSQKCPDTHYFFPDEFFSEFYKADKQCAGFVTYEVDDETRIVTSCTWNDEAYNAYLATLPPPYVPTNAEKRKQAYETGHVDGDETSYMVIWDNTEYTTDSLTALGQQYEFRGETETAAQIAAIVEEGVAKIRNAYPAEDSAVESEAEWV